MTQETTANTVLNELLDQGIIHEKHINEVWSYLVQVYAVGYEMGAESLDPSIPVLQLSKDGKPMRVFQSIRKAARSLGLCDSSIGKVCRGEMGQTGGYKWQYVNKRQLTQEATVGSPQRQTA